MDYHFKSLHVKRSLITRPRSLTRKRLIVFQFGMPILATLNGMQLELESLRYSPLFRSSWQ